MTGGGFKALKESAPVDDEVPTIPTNAPRIDVAPTPQVTDEGGLWAMFDAEPPQSGEFVGLIADAGYGKTGAVLGSLSAEEKAEGAIIACIDFDNGAASLRDAYHREHRRNIRTINPWVMQDDSRTLYDYPATHNKVMKIGRELIKQAQSQLGADYTGPKLHSVLVTAVDLWDSVAMNCMIIEDLGTAADGIGAKVSVHEKVGLKFNWQIRSTRFHQLTAVAMELRRYGVNVYYETHWKYGQKADGTFTGDKSPRWEKQTANYLDTIIEFEKNEIRDDSGVPSGEVRYEALFTKARTRAHLLNQRRLVLSTFDGKPPVWNGLPELRGQTS